MDNKVNQWPLNDVCNTNQDPKEYIKNINR